MADQTLQALEAALGQAAATNNVEAARAIASDMARISRQSHPNYGLPDPVKLGQENMPQSIRDVAKDSGVASQRMAGIGSAPAIAGHAVGQLFGADNKDDIQNWQSLRSATPDTTMGNVAGNALMYGGAPTRAVQPVASVASRAAPWLKPAADVAGTRWGTVADVAATQGGLGALTAPGDVADRGVAGVLSMAGASAAPGSVAAAQTGRRAVTSKGKQLSIAERLREELGPDTQSLITTLDANHYPTSGIGVQPSAAMLTRNPTLQVLETGSRTRTPDQWMNFDKANATARWQELEKSAGTPEELAKLKDARNALTTPMREGALSGNGATSGHWANIRNVDLGDLTSKLESLSTGANRPNKDVQTLVSYVKGELQNGVTPAQLYTVRKMLTDGVAAGPTSELSQAARAARPQRMEIIKEIDNTLNTMSGGKWSEYLDAYKAASPEISSKTSLQKITDALSSGRPVGEVPASLGERPAPYTVGRLVERHGTKELGSTNVDQLLPAHRKLVDSLVADLNHQAGTMMPRATLGSPTAPLLANAGRVSQLTNGLIDVGGSAIPLVGSTVAANIKGSMSRQTEEALATLLKDPVALAEALRRAADAKRLLQQSSRVGAGSGGVAKSGP